MIGQSGQDRRQFCEVRCTLEQTGVQIEDVAGIGLTSRRALEQKRKCTVSDRVLGQIVVNDQNVLALVHEVFADGSSPRRERCTAAVQARMRLRRRRMV